MGGAAPLPCLEFRIALGGHFIVFKTDNPQSGLRLYGTVIRKVDDVLAVGHARLALAGLNIFRARACHLPPPASIWQTAGLGHSRSRANSCCTVTDRAPRAFRLCFQIFPDARRSLCTIVHTLCASERRGHIAEEAPQPPAQTTEAAPGPRPGPLR